MTSPDQEVGAAAFRPAAGWASGVGSMPGTDPREAAAVVAGELRGVELSRPRRRRFKGLDDPIRVCRAQRNVG